MKERESELMINDHQPFNESKSYRISKKNLDLNFGMDGELTLSPFF